MDEKKEKKGGIKLVWIFVLIYTLVLSAFSFWKYFNFLYNGLDLAIFNQVFFNTSLGNFFDFSIHPHSYLGDHFTPIILFLVPFYFLFKSPLILLFLQSFSLGLTAIPVYLISKEIFKRNKKVPLFISLAFLFNPVLWNINLFEFHILTLALPLLLFCFYFYQKNKFKWFVIFIFLSLLVREDVSLVIFMFSFLPFISMSFPRRRESGISAEYFKTIKVTFKNNKKWIIFPLIISLIWFFFSFKIISFFNPDSGYKFLIYYNWLGSAQSFLSLVFSILSHPLKVIFHLFTFNNFIIFLILFLSFFFLPIFSLRYLFLALPYFLQIFLSAQGGSSLVFTTHYAVFFVFALVLSSIFGLKNFLSWRDKKIKSWTNKNSIKAESIFKIFIKDKSFLVVIFIATAVYLIFSIGPGWGMVSNIFDKNIKDRSMAVKELVKKIPDNSSVAAGYRFLPNLSSREEIYSLHYGFTGKRQFFLGDYNLPEDAGYVLIDFNDFVTYQLQFENKDEFHDQYITGDERIVKYLEGYKLIGLIDSYALFSKNGEEANRIVETYKRDNKTKKATFFEEKVALLEDKCFFEEEYYGESVIVDCSLFWGIQNKLEKNYQLQLQLVKSNVIVWDNIYPLSYGIYPTSDWKDGEVVKNNYRFLIPREIEGEEYKLFIRLVDNKEGHVTLDSIGSVMDLVQDVLYSNAFEINLP